MSKIIGSITATPNPLSDWNQTDVKKADYIKNKPFGEIVADDGIIETKQIDNKYLKPFEIKDDGQTITCQIKQEYIAPVFESYEFITIDDIDTICEGDIEYAEDVTF